MVCRIGSRCFAAWSDSHFRDRLGTLGLQQLDGMLNEVKPVGRKLDFLVQEMNRETNTIGSKANDVSMAQIVVNIKSEIEKIREQIQNIE